MIAPEGSWVAEARGHPRKLGALVVGLGLAGIGGPMLWWLGLALSSLAVGQLVAYWGDETNPAVDRRAV